MFCHNPFVKALSRDVKLFLHAMSKIEKEFNANSTSNEKIVAPLRRVPTLYAMQDGPTDALTHQVKCLTSIQDSISRYLMVSLGQ